MKMNTALGYQPVTFADLTDDEAFNADRDALTDGLTEKQEEISNIVLEAHDAAIDAVKAGIKACEVDKVARDIITEYGYGDKFIHSTGHSLGLDIHENPSLSLRDQTVLENNMIVTIEPGIYLEGEFGIRIRIGNCHKLPGPKKVRRLGDLSRKMGLRK